MKTIIVFIAGIIIGILGMSVYFTYTKDINVLLIVTSIIVIGAYILIIIWLTRIEKENMYILGKYNDLWTSYTKDRERIDDNDSYNNLSYLSIVPDAPKNST